MGFFPKPCEARGSSQRRLTGRWHACVRCDAARLQRTTSGCSGRPTVVKHCAP
jgi:hypothetical protein